MKKINVSDVRSIGNLTFDAINGVTDLVESMHHNIASFGRINDVAGQQRTSGITGVVYKSIRSVSGLVGGSVDFLLKQLSPLFEETNSSIKREMFIAVLNGVLGDYLQAQNNALAISMQFRRQGEALSADNAVLNQLVHRANGKIVLMIHGLCMNDLQWKRQDHNHGEALANDLDYLPIYLRYNSGRHISHNGRDLADLIEKLMLQLPAAKELVIVAHSMGGLVARSAFHYGKMAAHSWSNYLQKMIFLGTPHHGAPLERVGNWLDIILSINRYSAPFARLGKIRSAGVTDLRYGYVVDDDWADKDRFEYTGDKRSAMPLPTDVQCYTVAAATSKYERKFGNHVIGDGLVPLKSALGQHKNIDLNLHFPKTHQWVSRDTSHLDLLNHPDVYQVMKKWLSS